MHKKFDFSVFNLKMSINICRTINIVHYDICALSSPLLHDVKLGPERGEGPITPCNGLLKTLVSYNIL